MATLIPIPVPSDYSDEADVPSVLDDMATAISTNEGNMNDEIIALQSSVGDFATFLDTINGEVI